MAGEIHVVEDGVVDSLDAVRVVVGENGIVWSLDIFIHNAIDHA